MGKKIIIMLCSLWLLFLFLVLIILLLLVPDVSGVGGYHLVLIDILKTKPGIIYLVTTLASIFIVWLIRKNWPTETREVFLSGQRYFASPKNALKKILIFVIISFVLLYLALLVSDLTVNRLSYPVCNEGGDTSDGTCNNR